MKFVMHSEEIRQNASQILLLDCYATYSTIVAVNINHKESICSRNKKNITECTETCP